jgi:uncharacterized protein YjbI with pentapeptide repeats
MTSTREQLLARWKTEEGKRLAHDIYQALENTEVPLEDLRQRLSQLPFTAEVAPHWDFRGLHFWPEDEWSNPATTIWARDLSQARFDYLQHIGNITGCTMHSTIFDDMHCINGLFHSNFEHASFQRATLQGVSFTNSNVSHANFEQAQLGKAYFTGTQCTGANFAHADLRFADFEQADLRGANFQNAVLADTNLHNALFDDQTNLQGADMHGAAMSHELRAFAQASGAILSDPTFWNQDYDLAVVNALVQIMQEKEYNEDGHLDAVALPTMIKIRDELHEHVKQGVYFTWEQRFEELTSETWPRELVEEVEYLYGEAGRLLSYYL